MKGSFPTEGAFHFAFFIADYNQQQLLKSCMLESAIIPFSTNEIGETYSLIFSWACKISKKGRQGMAVSSLPVLYSLGIEKKKETQQSTILSKHFHMIR